MSENEARIATLARAVNALLATIGEYQKLWILPPHGEHDLLALRKELEIAMHDGEQA